MNIKTLQDKKVIESHFRKNTDLHIYSIGDLDDFFWKFTSWFAYKSENNIEQIVLLYSGFDPPTFIALTDRKPELMKDFIEKVIPELPVKIYAHLSPGLIKVFGGKSIIKNFGKHYKMALKNKSLLQNTDYENIRRLNPKDYFKIKDLYDSNYPENFFDKRMLETGKYFGYFDKEELIGISGIHVYSEKYKVAALGNITTDINYRGRSIATKLTSVLCSDLLKTVDNIGLNVSIQNHAAITCYKKIGFEIIGEYEEYLLENMKTAIQKNHII